MKRDAMERLDGLLDRELGGRNTLGAVKRAVRALLRERADAAVEAACATGLTAELNAISYKSSSVLAYAVRAAVLGKRGGGK